MYRALPMKEGINDEEKLEGWSDGGAIDYSGNHRASWRGRSE